MKKGIFIAILGLSHLGLFAQEKSTNAGYASNGFWDNWFLNIGGGGGIYFGENGGFINGEAKQSDEADLLERLTWGATISVGKWFSPLVGARLTFQGGAKHTFNKADAASNPGHRMATGNYLTTHIDGMLNLSNLVAGYKPDRFYNLIPYVGIGVGADRDGNKYRYGSVVPVVGLLNTFRVSNGLAITLDLSGQAVQSKWNDARFDTRKRDQPNYDRQDWDGIGSAMLGLSFNLGGKQKFERTATTFIDNTDNSMLEGLSNQVNSLTAENESLRKQLADAKKDTGTTTTTTVSKDIPYPVHFSINKAVIEPSQEVILYNVAEFLKDNPDTVVKIIGYADKGTGTSAINKALSQRRAQAVENKLSKDYGISKNRIISSFKGDNIQPYPVNEWNRVVVITITD